MNTSEWIQVYGGDLQVALFFGLFILLAVVERLIPRRPGDLVRRGRWPANIGAAVIDPSGPVVGQSASSTKSLLAPIWIFGSQLAMFDVPVRHYVK